jgi:hypothetical protein
LAELIWEINLGGCQLFCKIATTCTETVSFEIPSLAQYGHFTGCYDKEMRFENPESSTELSLDQIKSELNKTLFSSDLVDHANLNHFAKESADKMLDRLLMEGWLSEKKLRRTIEDNGIAHLPIFIINVNELAIGADACGLSGEELDELKSKVGLVDVEYMLNVLKEKFAARIPKS